MSDVRKAAPLSHAQQQLWFIDQFRPQDVSSNLPIVWRIRGDLRVDAVSRTLQTIAARHGALRTRFVEIDGEPFQVVEDGLIVDVPVESLEHLTPAEQTEAIAAILDRETTRRFDLSTGPVIRFRLVRLGEGDQLLCRTMHHIAYDGFSEQIFRREFKALYTAFARGQDNPLTELPAQYSEFVERQRARTGAQGFERGLTFWQQELAGLPDRLDLPLTRRRDGVRTYRGVALQRPLGAARRAELLDACRRHGVTVFMFLASVLEVLLWRWTGQLDFAIGAPMANRGDRRTSTTIGCFANMVLIRSDLRPDTTFGALLERVRVRCAAAYLHQDVPFDMVVERLRPPRDHGGNLPVQVVLNVMNYPRTSPVGDGLLLESYTGLELPAFSRFDLTMYVVPRDHLPVRAVFDSECFDPRQVEAFLDEFEALLEQALRSPELAVPHYSLATPGGRAVIPDPRAPLSTASGPTVLERFCCQAAQCPERVAVTLPDEALTYACLDAASDDVAAWLGAAGVRGVVPILARRTASLIIAILGVWKAGRAIAVLDANLPTPRLIDLLREYGGSSVLDACGAGGISLDTNAALGAAGGPCVTTVEAAIAQGRAVRTGTRFASYEAAESATAYVAATSGSTGRPKIVSGTHAPLAHFVEWYVRRFAIDASDRVSLLSSLGHDPMLRDLIIPLSVGGLICLPPAEPAHGEAVLPWAEQVGVTIMHLTPALARVFGRARKRELLRTLRLACFGGDVLTGADLRTFRILAPSAALVNMYGTTETPQAMAYCVAGDADLEKPVVPLGRGIDDVQVLVLREDGEPCGVNERGEIHVRTHFLTRGYTNDPDATRERYINDPDAPDGEVRIYKTGDMGWYGVDGEVYFAGRRDQQLKIRGYRVEPSEVHVALRAHSSIRDAAVMKVVDAHGGDRLVAYVATAGRKLNLRDLRQRLKRTLPGYMLPAAICVIDALPRTSTGKIDLNALPPFRWGASDAYVPPRNDTERRICRAFEDVLSLERVGVDDDFFDLGGHSIAAVVLAGRLRSVLNTGLTVREVFASPTPRALSRLVRRHGERRGPAAAHAGPIGASRPKLGDPS